MSRGPARPPGRVAPAAARAGVWLAGALVLAFLLLFLVLPVGRVFITAFLDGPTALHAGPLQRLLLARG
jgi:ABC-type sulfate transport system permease subunit